MEFVTYFSTIEVTIPLSQLLLLLVLSTIALLFRRIKFALFVNYIFTLYWGYFLNRELATGLIGESTEIASIYFGLGISIAILAMIGFISRQE